MYGLAVCDMLARENRIMRKNSERIGERRGEKRGLMKVAEKLIKMKIEPEKIKEATGLTKEELEILKAKLKNR